MGNAQGLEALFQLFALLWKIIYFKHSSLQNPKVSVLNVDDRLRILDGQNVLLRHVVT